MTLLWSMRCRYRSPMSRLGNGSWRGEPLGDLLRNARQYLRRKAPWGAVILAIAGVALLVHSMTGR